MWNRTDLISTLASVIVNVYTNSTQLSTMSFYTKDLTYLFVHLLARKDRDRVVFGE